MQANPDHGSRSRSLQLAIEIVPLINLAQVTQRPRQPLLQQHLALHPQQPRQQQPQGQPVLLQPASFAVMSRKSAHLMPRRGPRALLALRCVHCTSGWSQPLCVPLTVCTSSSKPEALEHQRIAVMEVQLIAFNASDASCSRPFCWQGGWQHSITISHAMTTVTVLAPGAAGMISAHCGTHSVTIPAWLCHGTCRTHQLSQPLPWFLPHVAAVAHLLLLLHPCDP